MQSCKLVIKYNSVSQISKVRRLTMEDGERGRHRIPPANVLEHQLLQDHLWAPGGGLTCSPWRYKVPSDFADQSPFCFVACIQGVLRFVNFTMDHHCCWPTLFYESLSSVVFGSYMVWTTSKFAQYTLGGRVEWKKKGRRRVLPPPILHWLY